MTNSHLPRQPSAGRGSAARPTGAIAVAVALLSWVALVWLGVGAPRHTHPLVYFGLIFLGAGSFAVLLAGTGALTVHARAIAGRLTPSFVTGVRNLVLAMWWCAIVVDVIGCVIVFGTAGRGGTAGLGAALALAVPLIAVLTVAVGALTSFAVRRSYRF
ncbi:hypothetical protein [Amycolatopsis sp. lyj-23]|uniref:hypothetical protein n=1 Tax=Amycolatopsis sp. lyj-23 TaxID=2789283 RepID=UPI00397DAC01